MPFKGQHLFGASWGSLIKDVIGGESTHLPQQKNTLLLSGFPYFQASSSKDHIKIRIPVQLQTLNL